MDGLPFMPGNTFHDPTKTNYHRSQTLGYRNGYAQQKRPEVGIGGVALTQNQLNEKELDELLSMAPHLTYGQAKPAAPAPFVPAYVHLDKKVLKFQAWFKETVTESPTEHFRVRMVDVFYYLEDDSIAVFEPVVPNSGLPQGKLIKRQRLPKNDIGDYYTWKDLNNAKNVAFFGRTYRLYDCDKWTAEYLESEGIELNSAEECPTDKYLEARRNQEAPKFDKTPSDLDKLKKFLELDGKVLRFYCTWDESEGKSRDIRKFVLHYYLANDTLEIREIHQKNDGRDPFPILISRQRIPKDRYKTIPVNFPTITLELSEKEVSEYITPRDLMIGNTVVIYNRPFLLYDCDEFTKSYYRSRFGLMNFTPIEMDSRGRQIFSEKDRHVQPYNGYGTLEDSLRNCESLIPQPPIKGYYKMNGNEDAQLRYEAIMDTLNTEDRRRKFIITYRLSDDTVQIYEQGSSGFMGGKFLERTRVAKPGSTPERPDYFGPQDFYIGAVIDVFKHRFVITNADAFVLKYMQEKSQIFSNQSMEALKEKLGI